MYITNPDELVGYDVFWCNQIISEWLIREMKIPILCRKGRMSGFAKTDALEKALKKMPFWLCIRKIF